MTSVRYLAFGEPVGQGWEQIGDLALALVLCTLIGLERELRQKSAGLRTHTLVGLGAALFMLVSKYGFTDVLSANRIVLDPSRVAAQIVTGIGFIGGGVIFVRRDIVRGLTTAAVVWLSAAVGAAAAAGLPLLAVAATAGHFLVIVVYTPISRRLPVLQRGERLLRLRYADGQGVLREVMQHATAAGWSVGELMVDRPDEKAGDSDQRTVSMSMQVSGRGDPAALASELAELSGVLAVSTGTQADTE